MQFYKYSVKGARNENQDSLEVISDNDSTIACIADGVGGESCGKIASQNSVSLFISAIKPFEDNIIEVVNQVNRNLYELQERDEACHGMATTFTACIIINNWLHGAHVGDSRLCVVRRNDFFQLTENHTEVERLINEGLLTLNEIATYPRRHVLENALGITKNPKIQDFKFELSTGDIILLSTDGTHDTINKSDLFKIAKEESQLKKIGDNIVKELANKSLTDNASFILIKIE